MSPRSSGRGPAPMFVWHTVDTAVLDDGSVARPGTRLMTVDADAYERFRQAHGQRAAAALHVLCLHSRIDPATGRRFVSGNQAEIGALLGAGDPGWSRETTAKVLDALISAGTLTRVVGESLGRARGQTPTVYLFGPSVLAAETRPEPVPDGVARTLLAVSGFPAAQDAAAQDEGPHDAASNDPAPQIRSIVAGQDAAGISGSATGGHHHGMDDGSHPSMDAPDEDRDPEVEAWLLDALRSFGWTAKPSPAVLVASTDPAWLAGHLLAVAEESRAGALTSPGAVLRHRISEQADPAGWRPGARAVPDGAGGVRLALPSGPGAARGGRGPLDTGRAPVITTADILAAIAELGADDVGEAVLLDDEIRAAMAGTSTADPVERSRAFHAAALRALAARGRDVLPGHAARTRDQVPGSTTGTTATSTGGPR